MNPSVARAALIIGGIAGAVFVVGMVLCVLLYGCTPPLPPEPPIVMTCTTRDAAADR